MSFILSCLLFSFIGSFAGFLAHIFNGLIQTHIAFDLKYISKTVHKFIKVLIVMGSSTLIISLLILILPDTLFTYINSDEEFLHQLVYYLFAFAAFDFWDLGWEAHSSLKYFYFWNLIVYFYIKQIIVYTPRLVDGFWQNFFWLFYENVYI